MDNLCGDRWAQTVAQAAARSGKDPEYEKRNKPLNVSGVGHGSQSAPYDCTLPISLKQLDSETVSTGTVTAPAVANSDLPGLLGLTALRKNKAIIDFSTLTMYFTGPGNYDLSRALPRELTASDANLPRLGVWSSRAVNTGEARSSVTTGSSRL